MPRWFYPDFQQDVLEALERLECMMTTVDQAVADEQAAVADLTTVVATVLTTLQTLETNISTLQGQGVVNPDLLETIAGQVSGLTAQLSGAVTAAEPSEPAPADPTPPVDETPAPTDPAPEAPTS